MRIRQPAVAGQFYPAEAEQLDYTINQLFSKARQFSNYSESIDTENTTAKQIKPQKSTTQNKFRTPPKALIVPHAGYIYSGTCAASAYLSLLPWQQQIKKVAILGPAHREYIAGFAIPTADAFSTPFGDVTVNQDGCHLIANHQQAHWSDITHAQEHSIEVQLPFLQDSLDQFELLPLAIGEMDDRKLDGLIEQLEQENYLIIVSSDMSHFLDYDKAQKLDQQTHSSICSLRADEIKNHQACGAIPMRALLRHAAIHSWQAVPLCQCNSGDAGGDRDRVVGYASYAFY